MSNFKSQDDQKSAYIHMRITEKLKSALRKAVKKMGYKKCSPVIIAAIELIIRDPDFRDRIKDHMDYQ